MIHFGKCHARLKQTATSTIKVYRLLREEIIAFVCHVAASLGCAAFSLIAFAYWPWGGFGVFHQRSTGVAGNPGVNVEGSKGPLRVVLRVDGIVKTSSHPNKEYSHGSKHSAPRRIFPEICSS